MSDTFSDRAARHMLIDGYSAPYDDEGSIFEIKFDGGRNYAYLDDTTNELINKRNVLVTSRFPELAALNEQINDRCTIDGEIIVIRNGEPDFAEFARRSIMTDKLRIGMAEKQSPASFVAYDIVYYRDEDVSKLPLMDRKALLDEVIVESERLSISRWFDTKGIALFNEVMLRGLEGVVGKKKDSLYHYGKKTRDWVRIKNNLDDDFIICGYIDKAKYVVTLVLGQIGKSGRIVYMGHVTLGKSSPEFAVISAMPKAARHPFESDPPASNERATWIEPSLVSKVEFMRRTTGGMLRQATFQGLRPDKDAADAVAPS